MKGYSVGKFINAVVTYHEISYHSNYELIYSFFTKITKYI